MADRKAQLEISADASGVESGVGKAKRSISSLGEAAKAAGQEASKGLGGIGEGAAPATAKVDAATKSMIRSIERVTFATEAGSRTSARYFELLAQQRGINPETLRPYLAALDAANAKQAQANPLLQASTRALNQYGLSAAQTAAALRQVPAQLTDIVTSLQAGQAPLTVLLQQGGQLRDVFGGIAPAARALGSAVLRLINPFTLLGGAAVALGVAYNQGSKEADAYNRALILTGNSAGTTAGQLQSMAESIDGIVGTQSEAAAALAQFAATGAVAASNLEKLTVVAIKLESLGGKAVSDTVKEFAALGKDPVDASAKLNEQYNYLTLSVYEQIKALQEQGRVTEAASLAQTAFADALNKRADQLQQNLGLIERGWRGITGAAKEAWDAMLNVGRASTPDSQLAGLRRQLEALDQGAALGPEFGGSAGSPATAAARQSLLDQIAALEDINRETSRYAKAQGEAAEVTRAGIQAEREISRIREASRSNTEKLNAELKKYRDNLDAVRRANPSSELLDPGRIARDEASIRARFTPQRTATAVRDDAAERMLQGLREQEATLNAQLTTTVQLTATEKERAQFEQLIADLKEKRVLTADQKSLLAAREAIRIQLERNIAAEKEVKARADATKELERQTRELERFQERAAQIQASIAGSNRNRRDRFEDQLSGIGGGSRARDQLRAQTEIQREFQRFQEQLDKATPKDLIGGPEYQKAVENIRTGAADAQAALADFYQRDAAARGNWANGASEAFNNYIDNAKDIAGQTEQLFSKAFQGMEDALVKFITTGKLDFKSLADSLVADITRIIVKQQIMIPLLQALGLGGGAGGGGGALTSFFGSLFGGPRASGGPVAPGRVYEVNERGPELLEVGGRDYLMMGSQGGNVKPNQPAGRSVSMTINVQATPGTSRQTALQTGSAVGQRVREALARNS